MSTIQQVVAESSPAGSSPAVAVERTPWPVLAVIAAGGALGALGRYGLASAVPVGPGRIPWATFVTNVSGCLLIGVLMVFVTGTRTGAHPLLRPFLGVGVLGGYTTFSTYAVETQRLLTGGHPVLGLAYLAGTLASALLAVAAGTAAGTGLLRLGSRTGPRTGPRTGSRSAARRGRAAR